MRERISDAPESLDDLLTHTADQGECPVSKEEAQAMWDAASKLTGFAAVRAFLDVCKAINVKVAG